MFASLKTIPVELRVVADKMFFRQKRPARCIVTFHRPYTYLLINRSAMLTRTNPLRIVSSITKLTHKAIAVH